MDIFRRLFQPKASGRNLVFIANALVPTLQINFLVPLKPLIKSKKVRATVVVEDQVRQFLKSSPENMEKLFGGKPEALIFCRYSGVGTSEILDYAKKHGIPVIYHIDDDLLNIPKEIGEKKFIFHNQPERLAAVRTLLKTANIVYCANEQVADLYKDIIPSGHLYVGQIATGFPVLGGPPEEVKTIGYMGFDHTHDFAQVAEAVAQILAEFSQLKFEVFGPIGLPESFNAFGDRIVHLPIVRDYEAFMKALHARQWAVGIAPLAVNEFNRKKSVNKWVEYSAVGVATVATKDMIYNQCCREGAGVLVNNETPEWYEAMKSLITNENFRKKTVALAQARLRADYTPEKLVSQFSGALEKCGLSPISML